MTVIDRRSETQKGWQDLKHVSCTLFFPNDFCDGPDSHSHTCLLFSVENHPCFVISSNPPSFQHTKLASTAFPRCTKPLASFILTTHFHSDPTFQCFQQTNWLPHCCCLHVAAVSQSLSLSQINQKESNQSTIVMKCCTNSSNHEEIQFHLAFCRLEDLQTKILIQTLIVHCQFGDAVITW